MNKCFFTGQIIAWPQCSTSEYGKKCTKLLVRLPNPKKGQAFIYLNACARGEIGESLLKWYDKGDYLIFEGYLIKKRAHKQKNQVELIIIREYPVMLYV